MTNTRSGFVSSGGAQIYFEVAGSGPGLVMIHAGVADRRQWHAAFDHFQRTNTVLRYDMRGFGKSEPVEGEYRPIDDLRAVLSETDLQGPNIMMGCSMGGTLAMDYTISHPDDVKALIMVCSGPSGLALDIEAPAAFAEVEKAERANDLERVCELETQIWFDGAGRSPREVDQEARALLFEMNRVALEHAGRELGKRKPDLVSFAADRLSEIDVPVLIVTGKLDIPYMSAAAALMREAIPNAQSAEFPDAAHLPNMEHPERFNDIVQQFVSGL